MLWRLALDSQVGGLGCLELANVRYNEEYN